ncbi:MAG: 50S ribosomal protein L15 [Candidatus Diapherotrites archaeon]|uniref:Large ribosomal subunit protein uL15 n=1 Tax=Candidatus Iainarchaeum sp. TaxID=3101447 RepID=A0A2D6LPJ2_9ARCH|nr:50S ribosomal protein L15 [Candidatus Diapherotrites archaeon]|tara:strand:+ start:6898 stop:7392 length:495 start_codon:yes stop_codon:yes gene_type:complete
MVVRRRRKKNKVRGQRTHGGGGTKNRRGAGSRGGVGKAGSHKHKFSKHYVDFGVKKTLKPKKKENTISLAYINDNVEKWLADGKVKKDGSIIVIDGKAFRFGKVLGNGIINHKIKIENANASKMAREKIQKAGGNVSIEEYSKAEETEEEEMEKDENKADEAEA